ncbi:MAG TPA: GntR family transcriptional regulator [Burkholderiales bacterium]|jgi:DNA-binding GntR family transcriptional regulator
MGELELGLLQRETLRHQIENALRQAIMTGRYPPGTRLVERELCETFGVSRTSVREALRRLEAEKLVRNFPNKGPVVATISKSEAAGLYAMRALLEGYAAGEFARHASEQAIMRFGEVAKTLRAVATSGDQASVLMAKTKLYDVMLDNCGNSVVKEVLTSLYSRINLLRATSLMHPDRLPSSLREIDRVFRAFKARDAEGAEAAMRAHVVNAQKAAMRMLEQVQGRAPEKGAAATAK